MSQTPEIPGRLDRERMVEAEWALTNAGLDLDGYVKFFESLVPTHELTAALHALVDRIDEQVKPRTVQWMLAVAIADRVLLAREGGDRR